LEAANNKKTPADETERAKQDLAAQLAMARSADRMIYVGLAETFVTFFGVMLALATLIYTKTFLTRKAPSDLLTSARKTSKPSMAR